MENEKKYSESDLLLNDDNETDEQDFYHESEKPKSGLSQDEVQEKIEFVDENIWGKLESSGRKISFAKDVLALYRYLKDPIVKWYRKAIVVAALVYFIVPIDAIPDLTPLFGYLDDLGVITALLKYLGSEMVGYYQPGYRI